MRFTMTIAPTSPEGLSSEYEGNQLVVWQCTSRSFTAQLNIHLSIAQFSPVNNNVTVTGSS